MTAKPIKVCFLGYERTQTRLIDALEQKGCLVEHTNAPVTDFAAYDFVISYGYRHILKGQRLFESLKRPILNLHISYLPFNRGAHPNFWALMEETPIGVTIHEIDEGVDTGPICFQKKISFGPDVTNFSSSYAILNDEIEKLFIQHIREIIDGTYKATPQVDTGTIHKIKDLPDWMTDWDMDIKDARKRLYQAPRSI